jgi:gamma-butyrobetaine dioxygenase
VHIPAWSESPEAVCAQLEQPLHQLEYTQLRDTNGRAPRRPTMSRKIALRTLTRCIYTPHSQYRPRLPPAVYPSRVTAITPRRWASFSPQAEASPEHSTAPATGTNSNTSPDNVAVFKAPKPWVVEMTDDTPPAIKLTRAKDNRQVYLPLQMLRDACQCAKCVDPHSGQKTFGTTDVPAKQLIQSCVVQTHGTLVVSWDKDSLSGGQSHESQYSDRTVRTWFNGGVPIARLHPMQQRTLWDKHIVARSQLTVEYNDWMTSGDSFHAALAQLHSYGLLIVDGVPKSEDSVVTIANRIGNVMETFYGRTWDVRSKPQAENVAYTNSFLGLHQDLLYLQDPPRIQFLHCLENTCDGGESIFSDSLRAAAHIHLRSHGDFRMLAYHKLLYQYNKNGNLYEQARPVIQTDHTVWWSPPFQASEQYRWLKTKDELETYIGWHKAATAFRHLLEDDPWVYECKLKPGQCVIFDNLRVLHGRRRFDTGSGTRWLKGTYVANDVWNSKKRTMDSEIRSVSRKNKNSDGGPKKLMAQVQNLINHHFPDSLPPQPTPGLQSFSIVPPSIILSKSPQVLKRFETL